MKSFNLIVSTLLTIGTIGMGYAVPAKRDLRTVKQPDGSTIQIRVVGDEFLHFTTLADGTLICLDDDGYYRLAEISVDGAVISTGENISAANTVKRVRLTNSLIQETSARRQKKANGPRRASSQFTMGRYSDAYPATGSPKGLIILVEYSDVKFNTSYNASSYFHEMINGENFTQYGGTGSALQYFKDQSGGKFSPSFDIYGPVTLPNKQSYYGKNDRYGEDANAEQMVVDAVKILDPTVDFKQYDTDNDGYVDNVYILYAGQGEASYGDANTVWPHSWDLSEAGVNLTADGVKFEHYACSNEWEDKRPDGIGTFVHEFSHVMGLPDLYHTTDNVDYTPGTYSVLDYGPYNNDGRTPPNYGAYEKNAMGWYEPIMMTEPMSITLQSIDSGEFGLIPTEKNNEFFLFENRQLTGWDKYIPAHGMLIWHIDYNKSVFENNTVNNTKNHQYVDIVEANNKPGYDYEDGYTFPGSTGKTSFTAETNPAFKSWANKGIDFPITDIEENDGIITFDVAGGANPLLPPFPEVAGFSESEGYFIAEWPPVEGAVDYLLSVYGGDSKTSGSVETGFDNSRIPSGWDASATDWYTTNTNYGNSSPSYKFGKDGQTLTSEETDGDITRIEFWSKGQSSDGTYLVIDGYVNGSWTKITNYEPLKNKVENVVIENGIPSGVRKVRFTMKKATGNIAIDDIKLTYGGGSSVLPDYDNISTEGKTSYKVSKLLPGVKEYTFTVTATDGKKSRTSQPIMVYVDGEAIPTRVSTLTGEFFEPVEYYNLQGIRIAKPVPGSILIERRGKSVRKVIF